LKSWKFKKAKEFGNLSEGFHKKILGEPAAVVLNLNRLDLICNQSSNADRCS